jgi:hypothetical protein
MLSSHSKGKSPTSQGRENNIYSNSLTFICEGKEVKKRKMKTKIIALCFIIALIGAIGISTASNENKIFQYWDMTTDYPGNKVYTPYVESERHTSDAQAYIAPRAILNCDTSQPIDQGNANWQRIAFPVDPDPTWRYDCVFDHDWSNPSWTIVDALQEAKANVVLHYVYSHEVYPKEIAMYISEQFSNMWP